MRDRCIFTKIIGSKVLSSEEAQEVILGIRSAFRPRRISIVFNLGLDKHLQRRLPQLVAVAIEMQAIAAEFQV
jgi:hypothetical protein